jgi:hypothetical protein
LDDNIHTAHSIDNKQAKKDNACGTEGETTLISFRNIINMKTLMRSSAEGTAIRLNFNAPNDGQVG